jgi:uncharacterized protein YoxC
MKSKIIIGVLTLALVSTSIGMFIMFQQNKTLTLQLKETHDNLNNTVKVMSDTINDYDSLNNSLLERYNKLVIDLMGK